MRTLFLGGHAMHTIGERVDVQPPSVITLGTLHSDTFIPQYQETFVLSSTTAYLFSFIELPVFTKVYGPHHC